MRSSEEYRAVFQRITDPSLALLAELPQRPAFPAIGGEESLARFDRPLPEEGLGQKALDDLRAVIDASRLPSPCIVNHRTTEADVEAVIAEVIKVGDECLAEAQP